jgi:hypothetical protein
VVLKRKLASLLSICKRSERRAQGTFHEAAKVLLAKVLLAKVQLGNAVKADTVVGLIRSD